MFPWPKDVSDLWLCLLWYLEGIYEAPSFSREAGKALKKTSLQI